MTALIDTLFQLEKQLGLELDSLMPFAEADEIGGYHPDETQRKWGSGAIWDVEGRTLYALIRALKPQTIVEIGSGTGCSTTHMAYALSHNYMNPATAGQITTIDRGNTPQIPDDLKAFVTITNGDAINYLALQPDNSIDFILEDADHSEALCAAIGELAKTKLKPGGVLMAHDAAHPGVGADVKRGYDLAGLDFRVYLTDPSDCGWAVWKRPQNATFTDSKGIIYSGKDTAMPDEYFEADTSPVIDYTVLQGQEEPNAAYQNPSKFQPGMTVKVIDPESKYAGQTGQVYDNYRSGQEPQSYGIRFKDNAEFWVRETDLEAVVQKPEPPAEKTVKRTRKKAAK